MGAASTDVLAHANGDETPVKRPSWAVVGGAGLLVAGLVAGVTYGVGALSGGGTQPEAALPGGAFGFVKVDLDPSAGQKIDGFRFMRKFPSLRDRLAGDDLREAMFDAMAEGLGWQDVDFDEEVAPWLGSRLALAAYPPATATGDTMPEPTVVLAVQVTDADQAQEGLDRLAHEARPSAGPSGPAGLGFVVTGDYALLAPDQATAERAARDAERSTLAEDQQFASDLAAAGDGVMAAWVDMDAAAQVVGPASLGPASVLGLGGGVGALAGGVTGLAGRSTYVARFDGPDVFEVTGQVTGASTAGWSSHAVEGVADLPASSVVAFGLADGEELVPKVYESLRSAMAATDGGPPGVSVEDMERQAERELGIEVPEDLAALLGDNLVAAVDGATSDSVEVGARVTTDVDRAERVLAAAQRSGLDLPVVRRVGDDELVVASTPAQAGRLAADGTLGERDAFRDALPGLEDADLALWVDIKGVVGLFAGFGAPSEPADVDEDLEPIEGIGVTVSSQDQGSGTLRVRLVAH
jgi:hypothetical protein